MKLSQFDYHLPKKLIAQYPTRRRDQSRLLILDRSNGRTEHARFPRLLEYMQAGDALVVNNTRVFKARLFGKRSTGGKVEIFLVRPVSELSGEVWEALVRPSRRVKQGEEVEFGDGLRVELLHDLNNGRWQVRFGSRTARERVLSRYGHVPLPQYISRDDQPGDIRRYQTVFARKDKTGAVAAPTAGFHLTRKLLKEIADRGVTVCPITLHVGPGTFKPITTDDVNHHTIDPEYAELSEEAADTLNRVRAAGGKIIAVGTTSVRTLESAQIIKGEIQPFAGPADLYIKPGYRFRVVDRLVTNFHLPKSSLLVLVAAFAGRQSVLNAYAEAIDREYRFYSYGDAMLVL